MTTLDGRLKDYLAKNGRPLNGWISSSALEGANSGKLPPPANAAAAAGNSPLNVAQAAMVVGEPIPIVFGRRRGTVGGVLIFPKATEARFENNSTTVTSRYHLVLGDGRMPDIQRRDVRLGECRIGTFSQNYNQRAGTFTPGNFATAQTAYTVPTFPTYTGGGGNYQGLSTFEAGNTFTGGSDDWKTAWNIFLRGGMIVERGRLLDSTVDSSDNIADLVLWALQRSGRVSDAMIDLTSLASAALFLETVSLWCNGQFDASGNLGDWLIKILPDFLLRETKVGGKFGLRPLLPVTSGAINTGAITPEWVLTEAAIIPDSYQVDYAEAASRRPVAMAMLWRQQADDTDVPIVRTLTVGDQNASGPVEQHDLSQYATTENHAAKVGAYLYARRTLSTHTATVRLKPGNQTGTIAEGDIVQLYLAVETSREAVGRINRFYQVESIGHSLSGEETLSLSHFPVNSSGQSLIALAVANATAPGLTLSSNRTGGSCDIAGASTSTTVPTKSTSGTPISGQATGGASSSTYWAATGQFIDLFGGGTFGGAAPTDSPQAPAASVPTAGAPFEPPADVAVGASVPQALIDAINGRINATDKGATGPTWLPMPSYGAWGSARIVFRATEPLVTYAVTNGGGSFGGGARTFTVNFTLPAGPLMVVPGGQIVEGYYVGSEAAKLVAAAKLFTQNLGIVTIGNAPGLPTLAPLGSSTPGSVSGVDAVAAGIYAYGWLGATQTVLSATTATITMVSWTRTS